MTVLEVALLDLCRECLLRDVVDHPAGADVVEGLAVEEREEDVGGVTGAEDGLIHFNVSSACRDGLVDF